MAITTPRRLSRRSSLVLGAYRTFGISPFSRADLIHVLWEADQQLWGLQGFENRYPNSILVDRVLANKDFKAWGHVEGLGDGCYRLTAAGIAAGKVLAGRAAA